MKEIVPDKATMRRYVEMGLTQQGIADRYEADTGVRCSRSAIGMALGRYNMTTQRRRRRHQDLLPWPLPKKHRTLHDARMLRFEGQVRAGDPLRDKDMRIYRTWRRRLAAANAVVAYAPHTEDGFFWVPRQSSDLDIVRERALGPGDSWIAIPHD